jgi:hypothetical protein
MSTSTTSLSEFLDYNLEEGTALPDLCLGVVPTTQFLSSITFVLATFIGWEWLV